MNMLHAPYILSGSLLIRRVLHFFIKSNIIALFLFASVSTTLISASALFLNGFSPEPVISKSSTLQSDANSANVSLPRSVPTRLRIDGIRVDAPMIALGLDKSGAMQTPNNGNDTGWYTGAPTPGEMGPSIIAAHVDTKSGPAVFWKLGQIEIGAIVEIDRADGTTARFRVEAVEQYLQSEFPTEKVYGNTSHAAVRLITCGGVYDQNSKQYTHNTVVFGSLVQS